MTEQQPNLPDAGISTILLVDDHAFLRDALAAVMQRHFPGVRVLQAGDLKTVDAILGLHGQMDLVLLDLALPDGHGLEALGRLRTASGARLVVMSADTRPDTIRQALEAGAAGYLPKSLSADAMLHALQRVLSGGVYVPAFSNALAPGATRPGDLQSLGLSPRQTEVLGLLMDGAPNKAIARELDISEATVKSHLSVILGQFGVSTRTQVVVEVGRRGWLVPHRRRSGP